VRQPTVTNCVRAGMAAAVKDWEEKEIGKPYVDSLFKAIAATNK